MTDDSTHPPRLICPVFHNLRLACMARLLPVLLWLVAISGTVQALDYTYTTSGGAVTITGYTGPGGAVAIPGTIAGMPVISIGEDAFRDHEGVTSITIPNSVTSIGHGAFIDCSGLTSITIPSSVTSIEGYAFYNCGNLTIVTIPSSVTFIGDYAFSGCYQLASISVASENPNFASVSGVLFDKSIRTLIRAPGTLSAYTIPSSVTSIGTGAFDKCFNLTSITIPSSITSIGDSVFSWCTSLTSITIPNSVTSIGDESFYYCHDLRTITIPNSVTDIGEDAFSHCDDLRTITIPNSVTSIGENAFSSSGLTSITIPSSITSIGYGVFSWCTSLTSVTIPNSVTSIGEDAFSSSGLTSITIPNSVASIGEDAFSSSGLTSITIPSSITSIGYGVFSWCTSLTSITIPNSVTAIGENAFFHCDGLRTITIPNSVTSIGDNAFSSSGLTSITIPSSVTSIGGDAFRSSELTSTTFTGNAPSMGSGVFDELPSNFKILYPGWVTGFTSPTWLGYPCFASSPEIAVQQPAGTHLKDGFSSKSFGTVALKSTVTKTFTIQNTGMTNLTGLAIARSGRNSGDFSVKGPAKTTLPPGAKTTFKVTFKPKAKGARKAEIHIKSNDGDESPFDITVTGKGKTKAKAAVVKSTRLPSWRDLAAPGDGIRSHQTVGTTTLADGRKYLTLTVSKPPGGFLAGRSVEVSPNLIDWYSGSKYTTILIDDAFLLKVRDNVPLTPGNKRYIRMKEK